MYRRLVIGEFEIEPATRRLRRRGGELVHLANRPFQVLLHLVFNRDRLVSRTELLEQFWDGRDVYEDALTRCLSTVRKVLDDQGGSPRYIETRWTEGYRFIGPCEEYGWHRRASHILALPAAPGGRRHVLFSSAVDTGLIDRLVRRGNAYLARSGNRSHRYALDMFQRAWALDAEDARALGGIAASHAFLYLHAEPTEERRAAAIAAATQAIEVEPHCAEAQLGRAQVAVMRAEHIEADDAFMHAEWLEPGLFHAWYYHGRGHAERADHEGALTYFTRAAETNPLDYQALALAEQSFSRLGLKTDAQRVAQACADAAERVLRRYPEDVRALSLASCVLPHLGRDAEARGWTERATALEPEEPFVNFNAACVYISLGDYDRALAYFKRVFPLSAAGISNWIAQDPCVDPVRSLPGFAAILPSPGAIAAAS